MPRSSKITSVTDILPIFRYGLARPNRFDVQLNFPSFGFPTEMQGLIESVEIPSLTMNTAELQLNTQPLLKIPYAKLPSQTCNITFRLDEYLSPTRLMEEYIEFAISNEDGEYFVKYPEEIWGEIVINLYNQANYNTFELTLSRALLTSIDTAQLSYDERDAYLKQTASFSFQDMKIKQV